MYVVKFIGAGRGRKVLVAEAVAAGELARGLGLPVPEIVLVEVDPVLGNSEPDEEVQDLLRASAGTNLAMDFLRRARLRPAGAHGRARPRQRRALVRTR